MTSPFVLPSPSESYFVAINPNANALNAVPFADGSSDLLFAAFGQGSVMDFDVLLVHAQESLHLSTTDCRRTWIVLRIDGTLGQFYDDTLNHSTHQSLGSESYSAVLRRPATVGDIQISHIDTPESKVPLPTPLTPLLCSP